MCGAEQLPGQLCACFISVVVFTEEDELPGPARVFALWLPPPAAEVKQVSAALKAARRPHLSRRLEKLLTQPSR